MSRLYGMIANMHEGECVWSENNDTVRYVECSYMCGGKYLLTENSEVCGLTDNVGKCIEFLNWEVDCVS